MKEYSTEYVECARKVYRNENLYHRAGILFDTFLLMPTEILQAVRNRPADAQPLLPRQERVMNEQLVRELAEREEAALPAGTTLRGDRYVQGLRHHAYAVSGTLHLDLARKEVS